MAKIKEVSSYNGTSWDTPVPIGANDANIDITSSTTNPTDTTSTSAGLVDSNVTVVSGDTAASAWTKFNRFRKRVQNAFGNFAGVTLRTAYNTSNTDTSVYTTGVINNYMSNVIGYTGTTEPSAGTVAAQLSSLNSNINDLKIISSGNADGQNTKGYIKTPDGVLVQYGTTVFDAAGYADVVFDEIFYAEPFMSLSWVKNSSSVVACIAGNVSKNGMTIHAFEAAYIKWLAIGRWKA